ncbi:hypothetical protein PHLGIDRAFT_206044 [Phlebiopsis gigantea 11061_1 CR5-6]|uniref:Uncharacterized protein n=1 Tax=Phlebiopsis gigantea (strain 11061_1 CR5-6) TaxID=745531 RepID=A0A0C3RTR0_PHLG1|nr:hypothetical protein PHLGIDRAFT_206044 [Phlebiopsis gigantea 11061_1 CR5-6]
MLGRIATHHVIFLSLCILSAVQGNTEIANIKAVRSEITVRQPPTAWPILSPASPEITSTLTPVPLNTWQDVCSEEDLTCPHDLWTVLDLDHSAWERFSKFTLRVSLPANHPADCVIDVFRPSELPFPTTPPKDVSAEGDLGTRLQYARIRLKDIGIRTPPFTYSRSDAVPFTVVLEPLYFGVLPASVVPVLGFLLPVVAVAWLVVVPRVHRYLSSVAADVQHSKQKSD